MRTTRRHAFLALALAGAVAGSGCGNGTNARSGGGRGVGQGTFTVTIQNGQSGNASLAITGGYVTSTPAGIDCGIAPHDVCSADFPTGSAVTLVGHPDTTTVPNVVLLWAGDCSGTGSSCSLAGNADQYVVVVFGTEGERAAHSNLTDPAIHGPAWNAYASGSPGALNCTRCHGASMQGQGIAVGCSGCHAWPPAHGNFTDPAVHGRAFLDRVARLPGSIDCSSSSCHGPGYDGRGIVPSCNDCHARAGFPDWRQDCSFCHLTPPSVAPEGTHPAVAADVTTCSSCHGGSVYGDGSLVAGGLHMNGATDYVRGTDCGDLVEGDVLSTWSYAAHTAGYPFVTTLSELGAADSYRGQHALRARTTAAFDFALVFTPPVPLDVSGFDQLRLALRALNTNILVGGQPWQGNYPVVILVDAGGARRTFAPSTNLLPWDGTTWARISVPLAGGTGWTVSGGAVDLGRLTRIEIHSDTWEWNQLVIDVDAVSFERAQTTCSDPDPPPAGGADGRATIGPEGGNLSLSQGPTIEVPPGALSTPTSLAITRSSVQPPSGALTAVYQFGPEGTVFAAPVEVSFPVPAGTTAASIYWSRPGDTSVHDSVPTTIVGNSATARVGHFGSGYAGALHIAGTWTGEVTTTTWSASGVLVGSGSYRQARDVSQAGNAISYELVNSNGWSGTCTGTIAGTNIASSLGAVCHVVSLDGSCFGDLTRTESVDNTTSPMTLTTTWSLTASGPSCAGAGNTTTGTSVLTRQSGPPLDVSGRWSSSWTQTVTTTTGTAHVVDGTSTKIRTQRGSAVTVNGTNDQNGSTFTCLGPIIGNTVYAFCSGASGPCAYRTEYAQTIFDTAATPMTGNIAYAWLYESCGTNSRAVGAGVETFLGH